MTTDRETTTATIEPIRKQIVVEAPQATAFSVFTDEMHTWWKPEYSIVGEPRVGIVVEPRAGGRWFEQGESGGECTWGTVEVWDPPQRIVLTWQITADWRYDPDLVTELDIRFEAAGPTSTRVELEHRGLEAYGEHAAMLRGIFDTPEGWAGILAGFAATAGGQAG